MTVVPSWIQAHCVIPDGFRKGEPFRLYDYQLLYFDRFYLVRGDVEFDAANPVLGPAFVYRRGLLVGPQKLGKGPHTAAHVCVEGVGPALFAGWAGGDDGYACSDHGCRCGWEYAYDPGEPMGMCWPTPLIQITAFSEEQTDNIYDALRPMIEEGPLADVIPKTGEEFIRLPGGGRVDTVTSSAQSRLGQRVTFVPQDEVGIWTAFNKMTKVADTQYRGLAGMGGRASLTSNAWDPAEKSVAQQQYESDVDDIYRQMTAPPASLSYTNKRERQRIHRAVYPADVLRQNGGHIDLDAIEAEAADLIKKDPAQGARFFGNMLVAGAGQAINPLTWDDLADATRAVPLQSYIGVGFDGSISNDATALVGCTEDRHRFLIDIWERPEGDKEWRVPRLKVREAVQRAFRDYRVGRMMCDTPKWETEIEEWAEMFGEDVVLAIPTYSAVRFAPMCSRFSTAIEERTGSHDGDPRLRAHIVAMTRRKVHIRADDGDGRTAYVFDKSDTRKIDAGIACTLAEEASATMPELVEERPSEFASF